MQFLRKSPVTGEWNTMEVNCTLTEYGDWLAGKAIQKAMPKATAAQREFVLSGMTPEDWEHCFPQEDDDGPHEEEEEAAF